MSSRLVVPTPGRRALGLGAVLLAVAMLLTLVPATAEARSFPAPGGRSDLELRAEARFVTQHDAARGNPKAWYSRASEPARSARTPWSDLRDNARYWSDRMAAEDRMYHNPDRRDQLCCWVRQAENVGWLTLRGQNAAEVDRAVDRLVTMFMESDGHRRNIMSPDTTEIGVGVRITGGKLWVTVVFREWDGRTTSGKGQVYDPSTGRTLGSSGGSSTSTATTTRSPEVRPIDQACPGSRVSNAGFADIGRGSDLARAVDCLAWWGVTSGVTANRYEPNGTVTRAQMASFVSRALERSGATLPAPSGSFSDIRAAGVHADAVLRLRAAGVVGGFSDGSFRPTQRVTREQMATFLANAHRFRTGRDLPVQQGGWFRDVSGAHATAVDRLAEAGWALGTRPGRYEPAAQVTRAQMAHFLTRWLDSQVGDHGARAPS